MLSHSQRIERGLRKMWKIVPTIPLFESRQRNSEYSKLLAVLVVAVLAFAYPVTTILVVLGLAWFMGE